MKKTLKIVLLAASIMPAVLFSGCQGKPAAEKGKTGTGSTEKAQEQATEQGQASDDDFQRMGEKSFGLDVENEMTKEEVAKAIGMPVVKTRSYSNNMSTGCQYYIEENIFVTVEVNYGEMAKQKKALEAIKWSIGTEKRIGFENFLSYSDRGLRDVYMNVEPGMKFVRVGRISTDKPAEDKLLELAIAVEAKIRSFK